MRTQIIYDWCRGGVRHPLGILWVTLTGSTVWNRRRLRLDAAIRKRRPSATACRRFNEKKAEKGNSDVGFPIETERVGYLPSLIGWMLVFYATSKMETPFLEWLWSNLKIKRKN